MTLHDDELIAALGAVSLTRRPCEYRTSHPIEDVDAEFADGRRLALVLKQVQRARLSDSVRAAKPGFLADARREAEVYQRWLPLGPAGPPRCYAANSQWILIERVSGARLDQIGELALWCAAAAWLGGFHARFAGQAIPNESSLFLYDANYLRLWPERAAAYGTDARLKQIAAHYDKILNRILHSPVSLVHGDFNAFNVIVTESRVSAVDWELAGWGPALEDLAALLSGEWGEHERAAMTAAYCEAWQAAGGAAIADEIFAESLLACRLHLALKWLGWSPRWMPPEDQAFGWLHEALTLADACGINATCL